MLFGVGTTALKAIFRFRFKLAGVAPQLLVTTTTDMGHRLNIFWDSRELHQLISELRREFEVSDGFTVQRLFN
jgi:hypothetical protein